MILHTFDIKVDHHGENEPILLMPVGDIQWAGFKEDVAIGMLERHLKWGVEHNAYFLGMGDYVDTFSPSNRERLQNAGLYDTGKKVIGAAVKDIVNKLYKRAFAVSNGRWLGLLKGHHYHRYEDGTTTDQQLCGLLGARYLGTSAIIRLRFIREGTNRKKVDMGTVKIWCHHGEGAGKRVAAPLNKMDDLPGYWPDCDIFLIGHQHKKVGAPIDRTIPIFPQNPDREPLLVHRTCIMACTGGFLKGYVAGREDGNYVESAMLPPVALGGVLIRITPRWVSKYGTRIWLPDLSVEQ